MKPLCVHDELENKVLCSNNKKTDSTMSKHKIIFQITRRRKQNKGPIMMYFCLFAGLFMRVILQKAFNIKHLHMKNIFDFPVKREYSYNNYKNQ